MSHFGYRDRNSALAHLAMVRDGKLKQIKDLTARKADLERKLSILKAKEEQSTPDVLDLFKITGFTMSSFEFSGSDGKEETYTAVCADAYSFRLTVSMKEDNVTCVSISYEEKSLLLEIQSILNSIADELCPGLTLKSIQQFVNLDKFRTKIIEKLSCEANAFKVYRPLIHKGICREVCLIQVMASRYRQPRVNIRWTMKWHAASHGLVHHFEFSYSMPVPEKQYPWQRKLQYLKEQVFSVKNQHFLQDWWVEFGNEVKCS